MKGLCRGIVWRATSRGGTDPRKGRVGSIQAEKLMLYLYKLAKKWSLFYIQEACRKGHWMGVGESIHRPAVIVPLL